MVEALRNPRLRGFQHMVFDGEHIPIAALPGMRERTISIGSAFVRFAFCKKNEVFDEALERLAVLR